MDVISFRYVESKKPMVISPEFIEDVFFLKSKKAYYFNRYKVEDLMLNDSDICFYMLSLILNNEKLRLERIDFSATLKALNMRFVDQEEYKQKELIKIAIKEVIERAVFEDTTCNLALVNEIFEIVDEQLIKMLLVKKDFLLIYSEFLKGLILEVDNLSLSEKNYTVSKPLFYILLKSKKTNQYSLELENTLIHKINNIADHI